MCWPWWTLSKSPPGGKTDENEPLAFRGGLPVFDVHLGGAGRGDQAHGPRPPAVRFLYLWLLSAGAVRNRLADVPGPRLAQLQHRALIQELQRLDRTGLPLVRKIQKATDGATVHALLQRRPYHQFFGFHRLLLNAAGTIGVWRARLTGKPRFGRRTGKGRRLPRVTDPDTHTAHADVRCRAPPLLPLAVVQRGRHHVRRLRH